VADPVDYTFRSVWRVDAPPEDCYAVLYELKRYPEWWPEVKEVRPITDSKYELRCRSLLPYDLRFTTARAVEDPDRKVLEASMEGDLEGFSRWTIAAAAAGSLCTFDEHVITNKPLLNKLAPVARPAFRANHSLMMWNGRRGLRTFVAGYRLGRGGES
jgi:ribosome-associated toxin RatA of RatAB toxin-antitoxin module